MNFAILSAALAIAPISPLTTETYPTDTVVAQLGDAIITLDDVDAMAGQLPTEVRAGVFDSPKRIGDTLETMLVRRAMVTPIIDSPPDALDLPQIRAATRKKSLVTMVLQQELDAQPLPDFAARAQAYYEANPSEFMLSARVSVRHVLISTNRRSDAEALLIANRVLADLNSKDLNFDEAVNRYSEDPAKDQNLGRYPRVEPGATVPEFESAAYALESPGDLSRPVKSQFGYHIILLEERHPPEMASPESAIPRLSADYFQEHLRTREQKYVATLGANPDEQLLTIAKKRSVENSPEYLHRYQLELEENVLRAYKAYYLAKNSQGDFAALAREYYLTNKQEFRRPDALVATRFRVPETDPPHTALADIEWTRQMAGTPTGAQFVLTFTPPSVSAEQVTYEQNDPTSVRESRMAFPLKRSGDCSEIEILAGNFFFVCLISRHSGIPRSFNEVKKPLVTRFRQSQENKLWNLHVNEYHQLSFNADPDVVASLRSRYSQQAYVD